MADSSMNELRPLLRQSLADDLATRIRQLIQRRDHKPGDRLPSIADMARDFGVGSPTVREALRKLQMVGVVAIRHGSGVYVGEHQDTLVIPNPIYDGSASKKLLLDLIEARIPIELTSAALAAQHATEVHLAELGALLDRASANLDDGALLNQTNLSFHRQIAAASGNLVLQQLLEVLSSLFREEQRMILDIHGSRRHDHEEHVRILEALRRKDAAMAVERMRGHLEGVQNVLLHWDPVTSPVSATGEARPAPSTPPDRPAA